MKTTIKMPTHPVRFTKTPRAVSADYMDCTWPEVFDAAWEINAAKDPNTHGVPFWTSRMMSHVARYASTMTLRRAAKGW